MLLGDSHVLTVAAGPFGTPRRGTTNEPRTGSNGRTGKAARASKPASQAMPQSCRPSLAAAPANPRARALRPARARRARGSTGRPRRLPARRVAGDPRLRAGAGQRRELRRRRRALRERTSAVGLSAFPRPWDDCTAMTPLVLCALGDLLLDVIVRLEQPLETGTDAAALTRTGAGGQAANVAAWAAVLGAEARFIGKRGDDPAAALAAGELARLGV